MLRAYFVENPWLDCGVAVIANTGREAKKIAFGNDNLLDSNYTDLRVTWVRNAKVNGLKSGVLDDGKEALRRRIYAWIDEGECDECGDNTYLEELEGKALCMECIEKLTVVNNVC